MRSPRALAIGLVLLAIAFMSAMDAAAKTANAALPVLFVVFMRYVNGDLAVPGPSTPCSCGRSLPRIAEVSGRVLDVIRTGDVVDVLAAAQAGDDTQPRLLAAGAVVVLVSAAAKAPGAGGDRVVLVALPRAAATAVAAASLVQAITLTIH